MFKHLLWVVLFTVFSFSKAHAFVFIEPMAGYSFGQYRMSGTYLNNTVIETLDLRGINFGARGGLQLGGLQLGLDYLQNNLKASGGSYDFNDEDFKIKEMTAFIGYRFWFMRLYGGLIFKADVEDSDIDPGKGFKAGLSFYFLRNLALNLEYRSIRFLDVIDENGILVDADYDQLALLVSFPFGT